MLILLPLFCLTACAHEQPAQQMRLNPVSALAPPPRRSSAHAAQPSYAAASSSCAGPASRRLTKARKDELFRQFAAQDSPPDSAPTPAKARTPACRTAGR